MSFTTNGGPAGGPAGMPPTDAPPQATGPQLGVMAQYVKDFSFENPNAPRSLAPSAQPQISVRINVNATPQNETDYEVELKLEGRAEVDSNVMFSFELIYAGLFRIQNVPQDQLHPLIMIECPRLLFPFARELIASAVRSGGFPPLLLDPVDFVALYQQQQQAGQAPPPQMSLS